MCALEQWHGFSSLVDMGMARDGIRACMHLPPARDEARLTCIWFRFRRDKPEPNATLPLDSPLQPAPVH